MSADVKITLAEQVRTAARPLTGPASDDDTLLDLIAERGFTAVAIEGDWPDAYEVNCYTRGASDAANADEALGGFRRFPTWM